MTTYNMTPNEQAFVQAFLAYCVPVLLTGLAGAMTAAFVKLTQYLHNKSLTSKAWAAVDNMAVAATGALSSVFATLSTDYKGAVASGKLTPQDVAKLEVEAIAVAKQTFATSATALLQAKSLAPSTPPHTS